MKKYDVVIVGAGPGGLHCACHLKDSDKSVLVLEQNQKIGPKICAAGLTNFDVEYLKPPKEILRKKFVKFVINTPRDRTELDLKKSPIFTVEREELGQWQLSRIKNSGNIKIRTSSRVSKIGKDFVIVNNKDKIKFNYLVGADGSNSFVRKHLGLKARGIGMTFVYNVKKKFKYLEAFFDPKLFSTGYAWIFPHETYSSVGCGCNIHLIHPDRLSKNFSQFLKNKKIDISKTKRLGWPINTDYRKLRFKNIFLIGDAAGLASKLTGEGIYAALISGEEAARYILGNKEESSAFKGFLEHKKIQDEVSDSLTESSKFSEVLEEAELELIVLLLKSRFIDRLIIKDVSKRFGIGEKHEK
ncbi:MAG: NAD(P)/FAD-dependent oxidoreductase [Nanoarchaeota archaeon]|nr:NAD(P)/FAD-dependent oxidoreductase [Nanoarchaeota archaeon]